MKKYNVSKTAWKNTPVRVLRDEVDEFFDAGTGVANWHMAQTHFEFVTDDFAVVARAAGYGMHNVYSLELDNLRKFLVKNRVGEDDGYLLLANHSWGYRSFVSRVERSGLPFFYDCGDNYRGWYLLTADTLEYAELGSKTSDSMIKIVNLDGGRWLVTLDLKSTNPDGTVYRGGYYRAFNAGREMMMSA